MLKQEIFTKSLEKLKYKLTSVYLHSEAFLMPAWKIQMCKIFFINSISTSNGTKNFLYKY